MPVTVLLEIVCEQIAILDFKSTNSADNNINNKRKHFSYRIYQAAKPN